MPAVPHSHPCVLLMELVHTRVACPFVHTCHVLISAASPSPLYVVHACVPAHAPAPIRVLRPCLMHLWPSSHVPGPFLGLSSRAMAPFHVSRMAPTHRHACRLRLFLATHPGRASPRRPCLAMHLGHHPCPTTLIMPLLRAPCPSVVTSHPPRPHITSRSRLRRRRGSR